MKPHNDTVKSWFAILGAILGAFMAILDIQITSSSIHQISGALSIPLDKSGNISIAYLIAELICIPLTNWLANIFSIRRLLLGSITIFILASIACSFSWNITSIVVFRIIQGFAGAPLIPLAYILIFRLLPESDRMRGLALFGLVMTLAPTLGPTLGGWLTNVFSWQWVFYINVVPCLITFFLLYISLDSTPLNIKLLRQIDIIGIITMAIGLGLLEYILDKGNTYNWFSSPYIVTLSVISGVSLLFFFINEWLHEHPLIKLRLFSQKSFSVGCASLFVLGAVLYGSIFIVPLYLIKIHNYSPLDVGYILLWQGLPQLILTPFVPRITKVIDSRIVIMVGYLIMAISCFANSFMSPDFSGQQMIVSMLIRGVGMPMVSIPISSLVMRDMEPQNMLAASSVINLLRNLGGALGVACFATLISRGSASNFQNLSSGSTSTSTIGQNWLHNVTQMFMEKGSSAYTASQQAHLLLYKTFVENSSIIAFNSIFFILGLALIGCSLSMLLFFNWNNKISRVI